MKTYSQLAYFLRWSRTDNQNPDLRGLEAYYPFVCPAGSQVTMSVDYAKYQFPRDEVFDSIGDLGRHIRNQLSKRKVA